VKDKSKELKSSIKLINDRLNFIGTVGDNEPISIDYIPPFGDNLGYTSLELLLLSLSSCFGSTLLLFFKETNTKIEKFEIDSKGIRREEHPTSFNEIQIEIRIKSTDEISEKEMNKTIKMSEKFCPVLDMLKGKVKVKISHTL